jgi:hypothetical protein
VGRPACDTVARGTIGEASEHRALIQSAWKFTFGQALVTLF